MSSCFYIKESKSFDAAVAAAFNTVAQSVSSIRLINILDIVNMGSGLSRCGLQDKTKADAAKNGRGKTSQGEHVDRRNHEQTKKRGHQREIKHQNLVKFENPVKTDESASSISRNPSCPPPNSSAMQVLAPISPCCTRGIADHLDSWPRRSPSRSPVSFCNLNQRRRNMEAQLAEEELILAVLHNSRREIPSY